MFNYLVLASALLLSAVSGYYSIVGLTNIFSGVFWPIVIMGTALEIGKIITTLWLHRNWSSCPKLMKSYMTTAVVVLMLITSMGIFGFLSKAHIQSQTQVEVSSEQIDILDQQIQIEKNKIADSNKVLAQLDDVVRSLIEAKRVRGTTGAMGVRLSQKQERESLTKDISDSNAKISALTLKRTVSTREQRKSEVEFGPLKYIAELIYGTSSELLLEKAVRYVIVALILVFDPLALLLLIASGLGMRQTVTPDSGTKPKRKSKKDIIEVNKSDIMTFS